jgi:hypothetical protein
VSTSPTTVNVTVPSAPTEADTAKTSSEGSSVISVATSDWRPAPRSEAVTVAPSRLLVRRRAARNNIPAVSAVQFFGQRARAGCYQLPRHP